MKVIDRDGRKAGPVTVIISLLVIIAMIAASGLNAYASDEERHTNKRSTNDNEAVTEEPSQQEAELEETAQTEAEPEEPVHGLKSYSSYKAVVLKWDKQAGASSYEIWRSVHKSKGFSKRKRVKKTSFTDKVPDVDKKYYYRVYTVRNNKRSEEYASCSDEAVRTMYYRFTFKRTMKLRGKGKGSKKTVFRKGTSFVATGVKSRLYYEFKYKGRTYTVNKKYTRKQKFEQYEPKEKYSAEEATYYVNRRGLKSRTKYLIWVNTYTQQQYIFKGHKGHWKLIQNWHISTGRASRPTTTNVTRILKKQKKIHGVPYWCRCGHYSIHGKKASWNLSRPRSSGCVRNSNEHAKWVYKHVPVGTTVAIY